MNKTWFGLLLIAGGLLSACLSNNTFDPRVQFKIDEAAMEPIVNAYDPNAIKTADGIWYSIQVLDTGRFPVLSDCVRIAYSTWRITKTGIDTVVRLDTSTLIKPKLLSTAIAGMQLGLPYFPVGSSGKLYIPSGLAYGTLGNNIIPKNANLLFKVTVLSAKGTRFTTDTTALNNYINSLIVNHADVDSSLLKHRIYKDVSGIRYVYDTLYGTPQTNYDSFPTLSSSIELSLQRAIINSKLDTLSTADTTVALNNRFTPAAWKIILPKISVGTTILMFVPSGYGYGSLPSDTRVPANSNLVYRLTLKSIH